MAINDDDLSLADLSIFLAVFNTGGFRSAARQLGLSPSSVSEKITLLEKRLGVPLLIRTTRSVMPTEAGRNLAARLSPLLAETRAAIQDAMSARTEVRGTLRLNVPGAVMVDILPPLIDRFLTLHPDVRVEIEVEDRLVDVTAAGCDAGIRYGEHLMPGMITVPIGPAKQRVALAASPRYLEKHGVPVHPSDLVNHHCIRLRFSSGALVNWDLEKEGQCYSMDVRSRIVIGVDAVPAAVDLACAGHGILGTFENWLEPALAAGTLRPVLSDWWVPFEGPRLYFSSRFTTPPLRAFIDMISGREPPHRDSEPPRQMASNGWRS
jgi:DNA-binding transcriptional LysR family regulator